MVTFTKIEDVSGAYARKRSAAGRTGLRHGRLLAVVLIGAALCAAPTLATAAQSAPPPVVAITQTHQTSVVAVPKFIFHAGLAFGAFHHFIYLPFKAGKFTSGSILSKIKNYVLAGGAALFIYHEVKLALADAQQNKVLKVLVTPLTAAVSLFNTIVSKIKGHSLDATTVTSAQNSVTSIEGQSKTNGSSITEAVPSASQILAGSAA